MYDDKHDQEPARPAWSYFRAVFCYSLLVGTILIGVVDTARLWLGLETLSLAGLAKALLGCALTALVLGLSWLSGPILGRSAPSGWLIGRRHPNSPL